MGGAYSTNGGKEGTRIGRPRRRWTDNIEMALGKIELGFFYCIDLAEDRNKWKALVNLRAP
jgi:hypothetical protein